MTKEQLNQLGKTLWGIADDLRGAMNADDFRDYMLSFLFLRYLSDNYEDSAKCELGSDYPQLEKDDKRAPLSVWYERNAQDIPNVSTAKPEEPIDLSRVHQKLVAVDKTVKTARESHNQFLKELGLPLLP